MAIRDRDQLRCFHHKLDYGKGLKTSFALLCLLVSISSVSQEHICPFRQGQGRGPRRALRLAAHRRRRDGGGEADPRVEKIAGLSRYAVIHSPNVSNFTAAGWFAARFGDTSGAGGSRRECRRRAVGRVPRASSGGCCWRPRPRGRCPGQGEPRPAYGGGGVGAHGRGRADVRRGSGSRP